MKYNVDGNAEMAVTTSAILDPSLFGAPYDFLLAKEMGSRGMRVELIARPTRKIDPPVPDGFMYVAHYARFSECVRSRLPQAIFTILKGGEYVFDALRLAIRFRRTEPTVVHYLWLPFPAVDLLTLKWLRRRHGLVHTLHNTVAFHGGGHFLQRLSTPEWLFIFDAIIVHTASSRRFLLDIGYPDNQIFLAQHPPLHLSDPTPSDIAAIPTKRCYRILMWGALRPYKGVDTLIEASTKLREEGIRHEIVLAGQPCFDTEVLLAPLRTRIEAGEVHLDFGMLEESRLSAHIDACDLVVFPYREIEASGALMATIVRSKAVLATCVGGFDEFRRMFGVDKVFSVPPDNAQALANRLKRLIQDDAEQAALIDESRDLLKRYGDWAMMGDCVELAYAKAADACSKRKSL